MLARSLIAAAGGRGGYIDFLGTHTATGQSWTPADAGADTTGDVIIYATNFSSTGTFDDGGTTVVASDDTYSKTRIGWARVDGITITPSTSMSISGFSVEESFIIAAFRGVDATSPLDVAVATQGGAGAGFPTIPSVTPVTAGSMGVIIWAGRYGTVGSVADMTGEADGDSEGSPDSGTHRSYIAYKRGLPASVFSRSKPTGNVLGGGVVATFALRPA